MGWKIFAAYLAAMNLAGLGLMYSDKRRAVKGKWRIPEKRLFLTAILGGSVGCILGMRWFRHKTKHSVFVYGMPAILVLQLAAAAAVWYFSFR